MLVLVDGDVGAAGAAEGGDFGVFEGFLFGEVEEFDVFGVGAWPSAFDVMDAEVIEFACDADFVEGAEVDAFALGSVAQGGVVEREIHGR